MKVSEKLTLANIEEKIINFYSEKPKDIISYINGMIIHAKKNNSFSLDRLIEIKKQYEEKINE